MGVVSCLKGPFSPKQVGWLVVLGLTALGDSISVYIGPTPKERRKRRERTTPTRTYCKCSRPLSYWGWSGGAMVLGKLPVPGRPTILITVGQGPMHLQ